MSGILEWLREWNADQERRLRAFSEYAKAQELAKERERAKSLPPHPGGLLAAKLDPPDEWASVGRGAMDVWEPVKQGYLNLTDQERASQYRKQRAEDERLYHTGLLGRAPRPGEQVPVDAARLQGRMMPLAPLMMKTFTAPARQATLSGMGSMAELDALNELRRQLGLLE